MQTAYTIYLILLPLYFDGVGSILHDSINMEAANGQSKTYHINLISKHISKSYSGYYLIALWLMLSIGCENKFIAIDKSQITLSYLTYAQVHSIIIISQLL